MEKDKPTIHVRPRSDKEREKLEAEIRRFKEIFGEQRISPDIEKLLREDVDAPPDDTTLASGFFKDKDDERGEEGEAGEEILAKLLERSNLRLSDYRIGLTKDDLDKYEGLINELFTKKQIKNRKFFKAFLTCDDMESIANRARCTKQYIQKLFHEKAIEFVNSEKFIAISKDIARRNRVIQELKEEILKSLSLKDLAKYGKAEAAVNEDVWRRFEEGKLPDFDERAKKYEGEIDAALSKARDFTPGRLKKMMPCGG